MADPNPVTDRGAYVDKAVDAAAGSSPPPQPAAPATPAKPKRNKALEDAEKAIYGGDHSSDTPSNTGHAGQSTDSYNKY